MLCRRVCVTISGCIDELRKSAGSGLFLREKYSVFHKGNNVLEVIVNGESRTIPESYSVSQLIHDMDLTGKRIAVEINGEIVPASQHSSCQLSAEDNVEIVGAIGGG
mgnify:FL=1